MLDIIKNFLWSYIFVPLFLVTGLICFVSFFRKNRQKKVKNTASGEVSPLQTLFVTLASTIGTGNITGVALAIKTGGAGAVFWMWVAALFGMCVSYRENYLGILYRDNKKPIGYMGRKTSVIFSFFCILSAFGIGNLIQANSAANALKAGFGIEKWITGAVLCVLAYVIIKGGIKKIAKFTDKFVPFMGIIYVLSAIGVIFLNIERIPFVFKEIFEEALSIKAITTGALATGIGRGVLSGEAGIGSTVILSSRSNAKNAHTQATVAMSAIFIDTFVICTLTALAVLVNDVSTTSAAFYKSLGAFGGGVLDLSVVFFAFTTIIGWSWFGLYCTKYLFGEKRKNIYIFLFALAIFAGSVVKLEIVWNIGDISSALMAIPNLLCVIYFSLKKGQSHTETAQT